LNDGIICLELIYQHGQIYLNLEENAVSSPQKNCCRDLQDFILIRISAPKIYSMQISIADHYERLLQAQYTTCWLCCPWLLSLRVDYDPEAIGVRSVVDEIALKHCLY
jgi:hypothetical protein